MRRFLLLFVLPATLALAVVVWPLASGERTLCLRDVINTHVSLKAFGAEALRRGELPSVDPLRAGGQPYLGNLNAFPFYPTNLLFLLGSTLWALNAHLWLHWLLAPWAMFALARRWGLERLPAWTAGVLFAFSGHFVSQLNMANLVGGVTVAPALAAAALALGEPERRARAFVACALLWMLELLAGDPVTAAIAALAALSAALVRHGRRAGWGWVAAAFALGTLLAAPQLVELGRILGFSYRGFWGYARTTAGGWDPRLLLEWLVPFAFGRPDQLLFWGQRLSGGEEPLFFSLLPGLLTCALVAASGRRPGRIGWWGWGAVAVGMFLAGAESNPLLRGLYTLPGAGLFRFPVKFTLLAAMGMSLLGGLGARRLLDGAGRRGAATALSLAGLALGTVWSVGALAPAGLGQWMAGVAGDRLAADQIPSEISRWQALGFLGLVLALLLAVGLAVSRRRPELGLAMLLVIHGTSQLLFLAPALATDKTSELRHLSPIAACLPAGAAIVNGGVDDLFAVSKDAVVRLPGASAVWLARYRQLSLAPWSGQLHGMRFELDPSPEGLDQFMTDALAFGMRHFGDRRRLQVLRAVGADVLLLDREIEPEARWLVEPLGESPLFGATVQRAYRVLGTLPEAVVVGETSGAPHMNAALEAVFDPGFDPRQRAVLAGDDIAQRRPSGTATLVRTRADELEVEVDSPAGGLLVLRRAFLPIYRGTVDGRATTLRVANLTRLAVEVPAGTHRVRVAVDRRPLQLATAVSGLALMALLALARTARPGIIPAPSERRDPE